MPYRLLLHGKQATLALFLVVFSARNLLIVHHRYCCFIFAIVYMYMRLIVLSYIAKQHIDDHSCKSTQLWQWFHLLFKAKVYLVIPVSQVRVLRRGSEKETALLPECYSLVSFSLLCFFLRLGT